MRIDLYAVGELRTKTRDYLSSTEFEPSCDSWIRQFDKQFARGLAGEGLIGLAVPEEFGGQGLSFLARAVVAEELVRSGAPVTASWATERQVVPVLLAYGSDELKREWVPAICRAEKFFCIAISEPEAGSDVRAMKTRAVREGDDWLITGVKTWTSHAHHADAVFLLARTDEAATGTSQGLTAFVVPMDAAGIELRPIRDISGAHHFNEVAFENVRVPVSAAVGEVGKAWVQLLEQLNVERGGAERFMSGYPALSAVLDLIPDVDSLHDLGTADELGEVLADLFALRYLSLELAEQMETNPLSIPGELSAVVKDTGTAFEQHSADVYSAVLDLVRMENDAPDAEDAARLVDEARVFLLSGPVRGGGSELLRNTIARSLRLGTRNR